MKNQPAINITGVSYSYQQESVLDDINLQVSSGDFVAMIGPNGGGKTTLLKLMLGILQPATGSITILGQKAQKVTSEIGYVPQDVSVNNSFPISVLDVVLMGKLGPRNRFRRMRNQFRDDALSMLGKMGMSGYENRKIGELSGGQRKRVFIARALLSNPKLMLLDEPTANVDSEGQADLYDLLRELNQEMTIVVVSHEWIVISSYVKSVACVNRQLHFHQHPEINAEMMNVMYPNSRKDSCPVELIAHGVPHRVLQTHDEMKDD